MLTHACAYIAFLCVYAYQISPEGVTANCRHAEQEPGGRGTGFVHHTLGLLVNSKSWEHRTYF